MMVYVVIRAVTARLAAFLSLSNRKTPQGLCTMLIYVEIGADTSRPPYFLSLAAADLGICSEGSSIL